MHGEINVYAILAGKSKGKRPLTQELSIDEKENWVIPCQIKQYCQPCHYQFL
jgi:hypothetical protein